MLFYSKQRLSEGGLSVVLLIAVGVAGMIGALLRYSLGLLVDGWWVGAFPLGTLLINIIGSFALGWLTAWANRVGNVPAWVKPGIGTGLIGSFTTFSTFSVETVTLVQQQLWGDAALYVGLSLFGGLFFAWAGLSIGMFPRKTRMEGANP
jgi:CrcB protein